MDERVAAWLARWADGASWRAIATEAGLDESTVRRACQAAGAAHRRPGPRRRPISVDDVVALHERGMGQRRIAAALDCSVQLVRLRLSERGLCAPADQRVRTGPRGPVR